MLTEYTYAIRFYRMQFKSINNTFNNNIDLKNKGNFENVLSKHYEIGCFYEALFG